MFADRAHIATLAYKVGKAAFNKEHAFQIDRVRREYRGRTRLPSKVNYCNLATRSWPKIESGLVSQLLSLSLRT